MPGFLSNLENAVAQSTHVGRMQKQRKHIRLRNFDYSSPNAYFITICVKDREPALASVRNGICGLSEIGNETALCLQAVSTHNSFTELDEFIIMPNHLHCILIISMRDHPFTANSFGKTVPGSVSSTINHFKGAVTAWCRRNDYRFQWQSRFHDHVIRNEQEYWAIKNYIRNNPKNWASDRFHP